MEQQLRQAILDAPGDDLPRLVLCDYLEERATTVTCRTCEGHGRGGDGWHTFYECAVCSGTGRVPCSRGELALFIREQLSGYLKPFDTTGALCLAFPLPPGVAGTVSRGFLGSIRMPLETLMRCKCFDGWIQGVHGVARCLDCMGTAVPGWLRELLRNHPITEVTITDVEPRESAMDVLHGVEDASLLGDWYYRSWTGEHRTPPPHFHNLPPELFDQLQGGVKYPEYDHLRFYPTREAALAARDAAAFSYAKGVR